MPGTKSTQDCTSYVSWLVFTLYVHYFDLPILSFCSYLFFCICRQGSVRIHCFSLSPSTWHAHIHHKQHLRSASKSAHETKLINIKNYVVT